ncbi:short-chain dehydrogenases/reductase [Apiospora arundinis]
MVSLELMRASNARIATSLLSGLVAVFVGATSGIGNTTLKQFASRAQQPRIYFVGRRQDEGERIKAELEKLNPDGEYHFFKQDVSCMKNVDEVCRYIQSRESTINLLYLTCGSLITKKQTAEGLHYPMALMYYARTRFIVNLLPQLKKAQSLRRVVTVGAGGKEGPVIPSDWQANDMGILSFRPHAASMTTLSLLAIAKEESPEVSFIHVYPGFVKTGMSRELTGIVPAITKVLFAPVMALLQIPIDETGERQLYFATSARFPPGLSKDADGISLGEGVHAATGADGTPGGGVYSIDYEGEGTSGNVRGVLDALVKDGTADRLSEHTKEKFRRITGSAAI